MRSGYYKSDYRHDRELFPFFIDQLALAVTLVLIVALPFMVGRHILHLLNMTGIAVIGAIGLNILMGYTGQASLGHAAFLAIGAYATAILNGRFADLPDIVVVLLAGLITSAIGIVAAIPALRLKGLYLALSTLAFYFLIMFVIVKAEPLTSGAIGLDVDPFKLFGWSLKGEEAFYPFVTVVAILGVIAAKNLSRTKVGRAWKAIRDWDLAAEAMGINLRQYKILSFLTGTFYAGVAGSLFAFYNGFISPEDFAIHVSVNYIAMIIIGGIGTLAGTIAGAALITFLPEWINTLAGNIQGVLPSLDLSSALPYLERLFAGLAIVLVLIFEPDGLFGIWRTIKNYLVYWPFRY